MHSIRLRLLRRLIGPILLLNLAGGALTYMLAWIPAQKAFDQNLSDAAGALGARLRLERDGWHMDLPPQAEQVLRSDDSDAVFFTVRDGARNAVAGDDDLPLEPAAPADTSLRLPPRVVLPARSTFDAVMRQEAVRVVVLRIDRADQSAYVGVAKTLRKQTQVRNATVRALVLLEALFTLASVGLIWFSVGSGLQPLNRMRSDLNARGADDLSPISPAEIPDELGPVVAAFNSLLSKVSEGAKAQQDFLANVAHQLRTPLAGLRTQLDWLAARIAPAQDAEAAHSLGLMLSSSERMIRQTNQLLALARAEPSHFEKTRLEPLQLNLLVEEAIQQFVEQASLKQIDLGFDLAPTTVMGDRFLLRDLIDNLIDNALRYTPAFGTVTVSCHPTGSGGLLAVEDSGPGIPPAKREAVFSRFVRLDDKTTGSGLGLAIVRDIATAHGAKLSLDSGAGGRGALFSVTFP
jgi:two-component system sensor histidine kinase TctE